ncbi:MAG: glutamine synthetase family protein [Acidobacteriota bacterium]|nr:glutamine synthetase family protein [Acidobacteriota bacterium]
MKEREKLALSNPVSLLLHKEPADFRRKDFLKLIEIKQLERITFHYVGLDGKLKELKVPVASLSQAETILAEGERVDGSSLYKGLVDMGLSDLYVLPVYKSAFLNPFDERSLDFVCRYLDGQGQPIPFALDNILARAHRLFQKNSGLELRAMGELEFFLLGDFGPKIYPVEKKRSYHATSPFVKSGHVLDEMVRYITQITGAVKYAHSEAGYVDSVNSYLDEIKGKQAEQVEIEFLPRPVEDMGDYLILARWLIRNVAYKYGMVATFTPKIEEGVAGSGLHFHLELVKDGLNIMVGQDGQLSQEASRLIGGLCHYADSLTAFGNTVSSSYLRLVPNLEAPTRICWSDLNRSALIRVPLGWTGLKNLARLVNPADRTGYTKKQGRQTVELRSPDGSALIHLLLAGLTMAADWAFRPDIPVFQGSQPLELAARLYVKGNIFEDQKLLETLPKLPGSCVESSRILNEKRELYERDGIFPPSVIDYVVRMLQAENDEFMNKKLLDLPADDRLHKIRKIMHKDLHKH